jgi:hypothetical protein
MKRSLLLTIALSLSLPLVSAATGGLSAKRFPYENVQQAMLRSRGFSTFSERFDGSFSMPPTTPQGVQKNLQDLDISQLPDLGSYEILVSEFEYVRDTRFFQSDDPNFPRRATWLFPDDGCYARAEAAARHLVNPAMPAPKKMFVFGNMLVKTSNSPDGAVPWWYHVAASYRVGNQAYVIDPAIEPKRPLTLQEWNAVVSQGNVPVQYAICDSKTFDPDADCFNPNDIGDLTSADDVKMFFGDEWSRLLTLKRDPTKELGDTPPWR